MGEGELPRICPACGAPSAASSPACGKCGASLAAPQEDEGAAPDIPQTVIRSAPAQPFEGHHLPPAGHSQQAYTPPPTTAPPRTGPRTKSTRTPASPGLARFGAAYLAKSAVAILFLLSLPVAGWLLWRQHRTAETPDSAAPAAAGRYLTALSRGDYATAYTMLSRGAQARCTMDEFRKTLEPWPWTWANLEPVKVEPDAVVLRYDRKADGGAAEQDTIIFILEGKRWVRPDIRGILLRVEEAFRRRDPDLAYLEAQEAVRVNLRDAVARAYLCEAAYARKAAQEAERECGLALQFAQVYPSRLPSRSLYRLHAILGAVYAHHLKKFNQAADQYSAMLAFPGLSPKERCEVLLARADAYEALKSTDLSSDDLREALGVCSRPEELEDIRRRLGQGG